MKTAIIIPTHNRLDHLRLCLKSLTESVEAKACTIIVVENGSSCSSELVNSFKAELSIQYLHQQEGNKSKALNLALDILSEELIIFFDDDVLVEPGTVAAFIAAAETRGPAHFFGGRIAPNYESNPPQHLIPYFPPSLGHFDLSQGQDLKEVPPSTYFLGANWAAYRNDLNLIGGFSPEFGPGAKSKSRGQETEAQSRLYAAGIKALFVRKALVQHWVPARATTPDWLSERIYQSFILQGQEKGTFLQLMNNILRVLVSCLVLLFNPSSFSSLHRLNKGLGYLKGFANSHLKRILK